MTDLDSIAMMVSADGANWFTPTILVPMFQVTQMLTLARLLGVETWL